MGDEGLKSATPGESRAYDGEMDVWSATERIGNKVGSCNSPFWCSECGLSDDAW